MLLFIIEKLCTALMSRGGGGGGGGGGDGGELSGGNFEGLTGESLRKK